MARATKLQQGKNGKLTSKVAYWRPPLFEGDEHMEDDRDDPGSCVHPWKVPGQGTHEDSGEGTGSRWQHREGTSPGSGLNVV